jgi:hypothetical protein
MATHQGAMAPASSRRSAGDSLTGSPEGIPGESPQGIRACAE